MRDEATPSLTQQLHQLNDELLVPIEAVDTTSSTDIGPVGDENGLASAMTRGRKRKQIDGEANVLQQSESVACNKRQKLPETHVTEPEV